MDKKERQQRIEQFLRDELSPAERERFEREAEADKDLSSEVRLHQMLQEEFGDSSKQDFIQQINTLSDQFFGPPPGAAGRGWNWKLLLGVSILVVAGIGLLFILFPSSFPDEEVPDTESVRPLPFPDEDVSAPLPPENPAPVPEAETPAPTAPGGQQQKAARPVAQADFTPNPYLENLISSSFRGDELKFSGIRADLDRQQFTLEGQIEMLSSAEETFLVFLYSNKEQDFLDGKFFLRTSLDPQRVTVKELARTPTGEELQVFRFSIRERVDARPGLYYYFLARSSDGDPLYTGKIQLPAN